ncbi:N-acetylmuramoyl-L-alanine amidase [Streptosporangium sp. NBC_01639]|uniref:N-acetylmuramoyl-L-alanine amidase n=1 Tax=Streptosporangium sp. NBC_01639 TaxID=2975948 RepID=UPI00386D6CFB|nr:N-acetylmuramoyl-L-alanine amidase [Streptosporangium sp. NBC_01639]
MTSKAFVAALALSGLSVAACGGAVNGTTADPARHGEPASPAASPAASQATRVAATATPAPSAGRSVPAGPLRGKVVVIDPGHNGLNYRYPSKINKLVDVLTQRKACDTTGTATDSGYSEAAFTWDVSQRLAKILKARGATVKLTRTDNSGVGPCITQRAAIGNKAKADAAISIHADGAPAAGHGFHVIMPKKIGGPVDPVVGQSRELGIDVRDSVKSVAGLPYSTYIGNKALDFRDDLGGLNLSTVPKVFIESGNMRNPGDAAKFRSPAFRQKLALGIADGMQTYLK